MRKKKKIVKKNVLENMADYSDPKKEILPVNALQISHQHALLNHQHENKREIIR